MPVSEQEFAALRARVARLEVLVRQLQGSAGLMAARPPEAQQEVDDGD